jgi:hypothetical protein
MISSSKYYRLRALLTAEFEIGIFRTTSKEEAMV